MSVTEAKNGFHIVREVEKEYLQYKVDSADIYPFHNEETTKSEIFGIAHGQKTSRRQCIRTGDLGDF